MQDIQTRNPAYYDPAACSLEDFRALIDQVVHCG